MDGKTDCDSPYIELDLDKIHHNAKTLVKLFHSQNINVMGITKVVLGNPEIAKTLISAGIKSIGDSRIENIQKMKEADVDAEFLLIRTPFKSKLDQVIKYADISFNTELSIIRELSDKALNLNKVHQIVLMIEMGDLREGILKSNVEQIIHKVLLLKGIKLRGIGTNLACHGGIKPTASKMTELSDITKSIEKKFKIKLDIISCGNSANFEWFYNNKKRNRINNIRIGEAIFLGCETLYRKPIKGLHQDAIHLVAEVIESNKKDSVPDGEICQNAFGQIPIFADRGKISRVILGIGRQDVDVDGLTPLTDVDIIGSSSDHLILEVTESSTKIGDRVRFQMNYSALLAAMTSPYVNKVIRESKNPEKNNLRNYHSFN